MVDEHKANRSYADPPTWKISIYEQLAFICGKVIKVLEFILRKLFSRDLKAVNPIESSLEGYSKNEFREKKTKTVNLWGYKASQNVIILYCILILVAYVLVKSFKINAIFLKGLVSTNITSIPLAILALVFLEEILPHFIFWLLNNVICIRKKIFIARGALPRTTRK
jgi:hypothetical protein